MSIAVDHDQAFLAAIQRVADDVAAVHADDVDRRARFPVETIDALRAERALGAFVPVELGGEGVSFEALAQACFVLGKRCSASAMVFAMHQIQIVTIARHMEPGSFFEDWLRQVAEEQRLAASITSEVGTGGDMSQSVGCVVVDPDGAAHFEKQAPTISYGAHADDYVTTLRRSPEAEANDQVVVLHRRDQTTLEPKGSWDPMGMRGTCSPGFHVTASIGAEQVLPTPYSVVGPESMVPVSHILWSHLWLGIATEAFDRARAFVKAAARRKPGQPLPIASQLAHVLSELDLLRAEVANALRLFVEASEEPGRERLSTLAVVLRFNTLKIAASEQAPRICQQAMAICGIMGFKNDTPFSIGRQWRDSVSGALMVANERLTSTNARLLLIAKDV